MNFPFWPLGRGSSDPPKNVTGPPKNVTGPVKRGFGPPPGCGTGVRRPPDPAPQKPRGGERELLAAALLDMWEVLGQQNATDAASLTEKHARALEIASRLTR